MPLATAYNPDIFVPQLGMDALAGDLLAHLELTNNVHGVDAMYHYLFGLVPSRRLGIFLGIDLVPMKTCSLNCIYCES